MPAHNIAKEILGIYGLDDLKVRDVTISMPACDIFRLIVTIIPSQEDGKRTVDVLKRFRLVPIADGDPKELEADLSEAFTETMAKDIGKEIEEYAVCGTGQENDDPIR